ncbi:MAG: heavy-metal-associated domain-containing protein [Tumebacillaceae bacterium]
METKTIRIAGMTDESSAQQVQQALRDVWGIRSIQQVSLARQEVTFQFDEHASSMQDFVQALQECGFEASGEDGVANA